MSIHRTSKPLISVVLPVHNEAGVLQTLVERLDAVFEGVAWPAEYVFVDDGSTDESAALIDTLARARAGVLLVQLSRNFGHQAAVQAGLSNASGGIVVVMDTDLQDAPEAIPSFLDRWRQGADIVYAIRVSRKENPIKRSLFYLFYRVLNVVSNTVMPLDAGNFGLMDARVAREVAALPERDRYYAGLRSWIGFRQEGVPVERGSRYDDTPRVSTLGLFRLAKAAVFSFSTFPLTVFYALAALSLITALTLGAFTLYHRLFTGFAIPGWTSTVLTSSFFGGLNSLGIAVLGEFVVRIYEQVRARPPFVVDRVVGSPPVPEEPD